MKEIIIKKIESGSREQIKYIHPIQSNERIAKLMSAFANNDGGHIVFGIADDGKYMEVKNFPFNIKESEIRSFLSKNCDYKLIKFEYMSKNLMCIHVRKCETRVLCNGNAYTFDCNNNVALLIDKSVFLSYSHSDKVIADIVEDKVVNGSNGMIRISRDINILRYKDSLDEFMRSVKDYDFVLSIISDSYLKSQNCMFEISELMRDREYYSKLLFIIISDADKKYYDKDVGKIKADIYSLNRFDYITFWESEKKRIDEKLSSISNPAYTSEIAKVSKKVELITINIEDFISKLYDGLGVSFEDMLKADFNDIISTILT